MFDGFGFSGTLVTPGWVLTCGHGDPTEWGYDLDEVIVRYGGHTTGVRSTSVHPDFDWQACHDDPDYDSCQFDVMLVELETPLFPIRHATGELWEVYRRDLYRGVYGYLEDSVVDIYGYGRSCETCADSGTLRSGQATIHDVANNFLDADDPVYTWQGDSGGPLFVPSLGNPWVDEWQTIGGVASHVFQRWWWLPDDRRFAAGYSPDDWFDAVLADAWEAFDAPAQIMATLSPVLM